MIACSIWLVMRRGPADVREECAKGLRDLAFTAVVVHGDQGELSKISRDFGAAYKFSSAKVMVKEPFKLRIEADYEGQRVVMVVDGARESYRIPKAGLKQRRDLSRSPGGRQTFLDFGLLTPSLLDQLFDAAPVSDGVFDFTYKPSPDYVDSNRFRVEFDARRFVRKRTWYGSDGKLKAVFEYLEPKRFGDLWLPTDVRVYGADGKLAGETRARDVKVNSDLADALFEP